jgi:alpha-tubulin suppressor-like RCC1 family protein
VTGGLTFAGVSEGANHTCAHTSAGTAYCWGQNAGGQLGDGSATSSAAPVKVAGQP